MLHRYSVNCRNWATVLFGKDFQMMGEEKSLTNNYCFISNLENFFSFITITILAITTMVLTRAADSENIDCKAFS